MYWAIKTGSNDYLTAQINFTRGTVLVESTFKPKFGGTNALWGLRSTNYDGFGIIVSSSGRLGFRIKVATQGAADYTLWSSIYIPEEFVTVKTTVAFTDPVSVTFEYDGISDTVASTLKITTSEWSNFDAVTIAGVIRGVGAWHYGNGIQIQEMILTRWSLPSTHWSGDASDHGTGTPELTEVLNNKHATGVNMPTDGSAWVSIVDEIPSFESILSISDTSNSSFINVKSCETNIVVFDDHVFSFLNAKLAFNGLVNNSNSNIELISAKHSASSLAFYSGFSFSIVSSKQVFSGLLVFSESNTELVNAKFSSTALTTLNSSIISFSSVKLGFGILSNSSSSNIALVNAKRSTSSLVFSSSSTLVFDADSHTSFSSVLALNSYSSTGFNSVKHSINTLSIVGSSALSFISAKTCFSSLSFTSRSGLLLDHTKNSGTSLSVSSSSAAFFEHYKGSFSSVVLYSTSQLDFNKVVYGEHVHEITITAAFDNLIIKADLSNKIIIEARF